MPKGESLYHRYPDYRVDLEPNPRRVRVTLSGQIIADSERTLRVLETKQSSISVFPDSVFPAVAFAHEVDIAMNITKQTTAEVFLSIFSLQIVLFQKSQDDGNLL